MILTTAQTNQTKTTTRIRKPQTPEAAFNQKVRELSRLVDRLNPSPPISPQVLRLIDKPGQYDRAADLLDGQELLSVKFVPAEQVGSLPALHARWQHSSIIQNPTEMEVAKLREAEFIVEDYGDGTGPWCYYREKKINHAWVILSRAGWKWSRSRSVKTAEWKSVTLFKDPDTLEGLIPSLPGCPHNHRTRLRDSLIEAIVWLKGSERIPRKIHERPEFEEVMTSLWQSAVDQREGRDAVSIGNIAQA